MNYIKVIISLFLILSFSNTKAEEKLIPLSEFVMQISDSMDQDENINHIIYRCLGVNIYALSRDEKLTEEKTKLHKENVKYFYDLKRKMMANANESNFDQVKTKQINIVKQYLFLETRINKDKPQEFHHFFTNDLATCFLFSQIIRDVVDNKIGAS